MTTPEQLWEELRALIAEHFAYVRPGQTLLTVRHGHTFWSHLEVLSGWSNIHLSPLGVLQAQVLGPELLRTIDQLRLPSVEVFSSDLPRAWETTERALATGDWPEGLVRDVHKVSWLRECNFGRWTGWQINAATAWEHIWRGSPADGVYMALHVSDVPFAGRFAGAAGESYLGTIVRALRDLNEQVIKPGKDAIIVAHRGLLQGLDEVLLTRNVREDIYHNRRRTAQIGPRRVNQEGWWERVELPVVT